MSVSRNPEYVLLLGGDMPWRDRALLGAARANPAPVAVMQRGGPVNRNRSADLVVPGDPCSPGPALDAVVAYERSSGARPVAVVPLVEMAVQPGLAIAGHYGLPYLTPESVALVRDKGRMKQAFLDAGLRVPRFGSFSTLDDLRALAADIGFPAVIKPVHFGGSEGVRLVRDPSELEDAFAFTAGAMRGHARNFGLAEDLFQIEEYIASQVEVSVEVINSPQGRHVLAVTDKFLTAPPFFAELGHAVPSIHRENRRIPDAAFAACAALGMDRGIAHVEMRLLDDGTPVLMEVNARTAGDGIPDLVERVTGLNLFMLHCWSYSRDDLPSLAGRPGSGRAAIAFMKAPPGRIASVRQPVPGDLPPEVVGLHLWARAGDMSLPCVNSHTREGAVEFFWPDDPAVEPLDLHLRLTDDLTGRLVQVAPADAVAQ